MCLKGVSLGTGYPRWANRSHTLYVVALAGGGAGTADMLASARISLILLDADSSAKNTASEAEDSIASRALDADAWTDSMALEAEDDRELAEA